MKDVLPWVTTEGRPSIPYGVGLFALRPVGPVGRLQPGSFLLQQLRTSLQETAEAKGRSQVTNFSIKVCAGGKGDSPPSPHVAHNDDQHQRPSGGDRI